MGGGGGGAFNKTLKDVESYSVCIISQEVATLVSNRVDQFSSVIQEMLCFRTSRNETVLMFVLVMSCEWLSGTLKMFFWRNPTY